MRTAGNQSVVPHSRPWITEADRDAVRAALDSMMIAEGDLTRDLEARCAAFLGVAGGVAAPDGTTALYLALRALDVGPSDEVVIPTYVCDAVEHAVRRTGATPVLCDIGEDWCVNAGTVEPALTARTKAVVVVHTFGIVAATKPIVQLGVPVIEDLAQAFGATSHEGVAGTFGELAITSFHATKCLTTGEGGIALARDEALLARLHRLKSTELRSPLSNLQAALGLCQLGRYKDFLSRRREIAESYAAALPDEVLPSQSVRNRTMHFRFPVRTADVGRMMALFAERGVLARRGVDALLHTDGSRFPGAESAFSQTLSLPIHPSMSAGEVERARDVARELLAR